MISLDKIFDRTDKKQIKSLEKIVSEIDKLESKISYLERYIKESFGYPMDRTKGTKPGSLSA